MRRIMTIPTMMVRLMMLNPVLNQRLVPVVLKMRKRRRNILYQNHLKY